MNVPLQPISTSPSTGTVANEIFHPPFDSISFPNTEELITKHREALCLRSERIMFGRMKYKVEVRLLSKTWHENNMPYMQLTFHSSEPARSKLMQPYILHLGENS